jgi:hypothetical protein
MKLAHSTFPLLRNASILVAGKYAMGNNLIALVFSGSISESMRFQNYLFDYL